MQRLINEIVERAKANRQRIVLPEGTEERTLKAANQILTDGVADLIILGKPAEIEACAKEWGLGNINKATIIDPEDHPKKEEYAQLLCELRKKKGMTIEEARKLVVDPLYLGCLIIKNGDADGQLAGARNTTGNVLRPALQIIKTSPGITCVSGAMLLLTHAPEYGKNGILHRLSAKRSFATALLRLQTVHIAREHGCLADVVQAEQLHGQTLEADAQTAVRRHAVLVQHGEGLEQLGVHLACCELVHLLLIIVDTLAAGGDLQTAEQQVEGQRELRVVLVVHRVERTLCGREVGYEYEFRAVLLLRPLAQQRAEQ